MAGFASVMGSVMGLSGDASCSPPALPEPLPPPVDDVVPQAARIAARLGSAMPVAAVRLRNSRRDRGMGRSLGCWNIRQLLSRVLERFFVYRYGGPCT